MLTLYDKFPDFNLKAVVSDDPAKAFTTINNDTYKGKWLVAFFYPKDFTFVCPTEIKAFGDLSNEFAMRDAAVIGGSTDSEFVHLAWRQHEEKLKGLKIPLFSDIRKDLSRQLGILEKSEEVSMRATFIVDPEGIIRFASVYDMSVGRNPQEILRTLDALQTDELCPCNWKKGEETIKV